MERSISKITLLLLVLVLASSAYAQGGRPSWVSTASQRPGVHDVSRPLRSITPSPERVQILRIYDPQAQITVPGAQEPPTSSTAAVSKSAATPAPAAAPVLIGTTYQGQGATMPGYVVTGEPPDTEGAVGKDHFVQVVNSSIAIFDKSGNKLYGPTNINTLFQGFPATDGNRCSKNNDGDPIVYYDQLADRWVISQFDVTLPPGATDYYQCLAVSTSGDPQGSYYRWDYKIPGGEFGDYEKIGLWPDGYYMTIRAFGATSLDGAKVLIFDRSKLLVGAPDATQLDSGFLCANTISTTPCGNGPTGKAVDGFTPMSLDGFTAPPPGMPGAAAAHYRTISGPSYNGWFLRFYWLKVNSNTDGSWPASPTLTISAPQDIPVNQFSTPASVPQPGTGQMLDTLANNLMYRLAYRNYGTPSAPDDRLVVNHTVADSVTTASGATAAIRWYQFGNPSGANPKVPLGTLANLTPSLLLQETYSPNGISRWLGSIAMDKFKNIGIGYSITDGTSTFPGIAANGLEVGQSTMQGELVLQAGGGNNPLNNRWGDYSQTSIDPIDDCTFWHTNEYFATSGDFNWSTAFAAFRFNSVCSTCTAPETPAGVRAAAVGTTSYTVSWAASANANKYSVYRSLAACPQGTPVKVATCPGTAGCAANNLAYTDTGLSAGTTYYYSLTAIDTATGNCESLRSACVSSVSGSCVAQPSFAGVQTVSPYTLVGGGVLSSNTCGLHLSWTAGGSNCPDNPSVSYNVYRSTTSTFTPATANQIAKCVSTTFYDDNSALTAGTSYYYIVRAEDSTAGNGGPCNSGNEEKNTVRLSASPGNFTSPYYEGFNGGVGKFPTGWSALTGNWFGVISCSGSTLLHWGGNSCTASSPTPLASEQYAINANDDETSPAISIAAGASQVQFIMHHRWNMAGTVRDGLHLRVSVAGAAPIEIPSSAFLSGGYTGARLSDNGDGCGKNLPYKNLGIWGGQQDSTIETVISMDSVCGGSCANKTLKFYFTGLSNCTATNDLGWFIDDVQVVNSTGACGAPSSALQVLTATAKGAQNTLEWRTGGVGSNLHIRYSTTDYPVSATDGLAVPGSPFTISINANSSVVHSSLTNGTTYYYSAFVDSGVTRTSGGKFVKATPFAPATPGAQWAYSTGAASLSPPGGGVMVVSNDRLFHNMTPGPTGGIWPALWTPTLFNNPIQDRPRVIPVSPAIGGATTVAFVGSQDGKAYCVNADTGGIVWTSPPLGDMVQAGLSGTLTQYFQTYNVLMVGTRNSTTANAFVGLNPTDGTPLWSFTGASGIGIINGAAAIDSSLNKAYFASRARVGVSSGTVWCVNFTDTLNAVPTLCAGYPLSLGDIDGSPVLASGILYVGTNSGTVYALNPSTRATIWSINLGDGPVKGYVWPVYGSNPAAFYVATTNNVSKLTYDGVSATVDWTFPIAGASIPYYSFTGYLYVGSSDGTLHQLSNLGNSTPTNTTLTLGGGTGAVGSPSTDASGQLNVGTDDGIVYSVVVPY